MHGPLRPTYALLANYMAKYQMSSGPYGPIFYMNCLLIKEKELLTCISVEPPPAWLKSA